MPWTFTADAVRADLYKAYTTFLGELESSKATAFGIQTVQAAIARAMPQTFAETLLYSYGFTGSSGWVDLRPGMVLRVEYESYQTMSAATPDKDMLNGFITSAVAQYQITRSAKTAEGFTALDAFIGLLTGLGGTKVTPPPPPVANKQAGGGGLIDSGYPLMQQAFLRLVYPLSFLNTTQPGTPSLDLNAVLIAASKLSELDTATRNIRSGAASGYQSRRALFPRPHDLGAADPGLGQRCRAARAGRHDRRPNPGATGDGSFGRGSAADRSAATPRHRPGSCRVAGLL